MNYYSRKHPAPTARQSIDAAALKLGRPELARGPTTQAELIVRLHEAERALVREQWGFLFARAHVGLSSNG